MEKGYKILVFLFQVAWTLMATFCLYMLFALLDTEFEFENLVVLGIFQPILAFVFAVATIIACLLLGMPIRLNKKINLWWTRRTFVPLLGATLGVIFLFLSLNSSFTETKNVVVNGEVVSKEIPNAFLSISGWFLTSFFLLHLYPPTSIKRFIVSLFAKAYGGEQKYGS